MTERPTCHCHMEPMVKNGGGTFRCAVTNREKCRVARQTPGTAAFEESHSPGMNGYVVVQPGGHRGAEDIEVLPLPDMYEVPPYGSGKPIQEWTEEQRNYHRWSHRFRVRELRKLRANGQRRMEHKEAQLQVLGQQLQAAVDRLNDSLRREAAA